MKPLEGFDVQQTNYDVWDGSVASDFAGGTGTQLDLYLISSASQLTPGCLDMAERFPI
jgi:hypothetical protein